MNINNYIQFVMDNLQWIINILIMSVFMDLIELEKGIFVDLSQVVYIVIKQDEGNYKVVLGFNNGKEISLKTFDNFDKAREYVFDFKKISQDINITTRKDWETGNGENSKPAPLKEQILGFLLMVLGFFLIVALFVGIVVIGKVLFGIINKILSVV